MEKYVKRLVEEWMQHGKIIIALDFDDTISPWKINSQLDCDALIRKVIDARLVGAYVVVFTACAEDRHPHISEYCAAKGLIIDGINRNPIELPYGNQNKIYANIFLDDRGGLDESVNIMQEAMYLVRAKKYGNNLTEQTVEF